MRIVRFSVGDAAPVLGVEVGDEFIDVSAAVGTNSTREFLAMGEAGRKAAEDAIAAGSGAPRFPRDAVAVKAPITDPEKVICIGMNYTDHCTEQGFPIPTEPVIFSKFPSSICSSGDDIPLSPLTKELDFEVELVLVVGKDGRFVSKADAMSHVAGYTVAHDVSARDWQLKKNGGQWLLGKCMDNYAPLGPAIVTPDELGDPHKLDLSCELNGETVQSSNTEQLIFKSDDIIEFCTRFFTLKAGDVILTGTPPGVGCFRKPPLYLKAGDVVTCTVDKIGSITNTIVEEEVPAGAMGGAGAAAASS